MNEVKSSVLGEEEIEEIRRILKSEIAAGHHEKVMEFIISNGVNFMKINAMGYVAYKHMVRHIWISKDKLSAR